MFCYVHLMTWCSATTTIYRSVENLCEEMGYEFSLNRLFFVAPFVFAFLDYSTARFRLVNHGWG